MINIKVWYFPRDSFLTLAKQYFRYGRGRCLVSAYHAKNPSRGRIPFYGLVFTIILLVVSYSVYYVSGKAIYLLLAPMITFLFITICICESIRISISNRKQLLADIWRNELIKPPSIFMSIIMCTIALIIIPIMHMLGYLYQFIRIRIRGVSW